MKDLIILGGGFAGLWAAFNAAAERQKGGPEALARSRITLISRDAYHVNRPSLYQGAGEDKRVPLAPLLARIGVQFRQEEVAGVDPKRKVIALSGTGETVAYDALVLATGSRLRALPAPGIQDFAFSADSYEDAEALDSHLERLIAQGNGADETLVVVGAGFTGLELACELRRRLRQATGRQARIVLVDRAERAGEELGVNPQPYIDEALRLNEIELRLGRTLAELGADYARLSDGEVIETRTVVLATGMEASPLTGTFDAKRDQLGRLMVEADLSLAGCDGIFAAGDVALAQTDGTQRTLMSCQHAIPMGQVAGINAVRSLRGEATRPYSQPFYATCLALGEWGSLFTLGWDRAMEKTGAEAQALKETILSEWIVPPSAELPPEEILARMSLEAQESAA